MASAGGEQSRTGEPFEVYVTHVKVNRDLGQVNFWAQLDPEGAEQLEELDLVIQEKANSDPYPPEPKSLLVGEPCLANFIEDSRWYRARVEQCTENDVIAYFMDYGNTEIIPFNLIRRADASVFATLRAQATECVLEGVRIADKSGALSYLKKLMSDQSFIGKPAGLMAGRVHMTLQMETESQEMVADKIVREGYGQPMKVRMPSGSGERHSSTGGSSGGDRKVHFRNMGLDVGSREKLFISHIESPSSFWIQQACISLDLDNLMNDLSQFYCEGSGGQVVRRAEDGMACVALFSEDETFYRAVVDKMLANNQCRVLFVDYGNKEVTSISNLRVITEEFVKLPTIAIKCCLSGIEEASCTSPEATGRFEDLTGEKELCGKVVGFRGDKCAILLVDPNGKENADIAGVLVKEGLANRDQEQFPMKGTRRTSERAGRASPVSSTSSSGSLQQPPNRGRIRSDEMSQEPQGPTAFTMPSLRPGTKHQVQVTSVGSLSSFSCQLLKDTEIFDEMMASLQDAYASPTPDTRLNSPRVNQPCCSQFTEDDSWYRAQITATRGSDYDVTYVDYGNSEVISGSRLRVLKSQFFQLPLQCISCSLDGIPPQDGSSEKAREHFENITSEKTLIAGIVSIKHEGNGNVYGMVLTEEGTGVNINKEIHKFLQSIKTPPRDTFQSSQPSRSSARDQFQSSQPSRPPLGRQQQQGGFQQQQGGFQQQQGGFQQKTPPRDQFQKSVKSPPRSDAQFGQDRSGKGFGQERPSQGFGQTGPAKQAPSPGRSAAPAPAAPVAPAEPITYTEVSLPNGPVQVYLSHGNSPTEFWCQPIKSGSELDQLMEKIHTKCSGKSVPNPKNVAVGTPCIAQFSEDQGWYRAVVINKHVGELEVLFVDYGNSERVTMAKVKQISPDLMKLPAQAVKCALKGWDLGEAQPIVINKMRDLANTVEQFKCESHGNSGGVYEVELSWNRMRMSQELRNLQTQALKEKKQKEAAPPPKPVQPASPARPTSGMMISPAIDNIKLDAHEDFIVSHVDNPARFWCQLAKDCTTLDDIMIKINDHYNSTAGDALEAVQVGVFCVAKYAEDDGWYRAQILKTISVSQVEVHFIDYGNNDKVDISNLRRLRPEFSKLKSQAVQCALVDLACDNYEQDLITKFEDLVMEKQLVGDVKAKRAGMLALQLFDTTDNHDININQEVQSMMGGGSRHGDVVGYPPNTDLPKECEVYATHIEGPHQFFVQMSSQTEAIETMSAKLQDAYASVGPGQLVLPQSNIGQACCAKFSEDEQWYRALVKHKPSTARATVCFIDFGNSEEQDVTQLKTLKPEFLDQTSLAIECRLGKCMKNVPGAVEKLEELMLDKPLMCCFHGNAIAPFGVTLMDGDTSINQEMSGVIGAAATKTASDEDSTSPYPWPSVNQDCVEVSLTKVTSPWDFCCQLTSGELNKMTNSLQDTYGQRGDNTESELTPGLACVYQSDNETWYRGEVISAPSGDSADVLFVDTGVTQTVLKSRTWPIDDNFLSLPRQAIRCKLNSAKPCSPDWDETSINAFTKMTTGGGLVAEVIGIDRGGGGQDPSYQIMLRNREGRLVSDLLMERSLAQLVDLDATQQIMPKTAAWKGKTYPRENLTSTTQNVSMVQVQSPDKFFVKPLHFLAMEEDLKREIEAFTEGILGNLVLPDWLPTAEIGMPCLAMRKDTKKWCRAEVQSVLPKGGITVLLVDEGIQQLVFPRDLRPINAKLVDMPATVVECKLKDVVPVKGTFWDDSVCDVFKEMTLDHKLEIVVDEDGAELYKEEEAVDENKIQAKDSNEQESQLEAGDEEKTQAEDGNEETIQVEDGEGQENQVEDVDEQEIRVEESDELKTLAEDVDEQKSQTEDGDEQTSQTEDGDEQTSQTENEDKQKSQVEDGDEQETQVEDGDEEKTQADDENEQKSQTEVGEEQKGLDEDVDKQESQVEGGDELKSTVENDVEQKSLTEDGEEQIQTEDGEEQKTQGEDGEEQKTQGEDGEEQQNEVEDGEEQTSQVEDGSEQKAQEECSVKKKSINEILKEMGLARDPGAIQEEEPVAGEEPEPVVEEEPVPEPVDPNATVVLYFIAIKGPSQLVCQPAASADKLQELMDSIYEFYADESNLGGVTPQVGLKCISQFTEDDSWYRATIESIDGANVTVRYTDYGNSEVVTVDRLCNLQPQFIKLPAQAITYQLTSPLMLESHWSDDVKTLLEGCCAERELKVNILDDVPTIRLSTEDTSFIQTSLGDGQSTPTEAAPAPTAAADVEESEAVSLIFLAAEEPSTLICQPIATADDLATLMDNIAAHYEDEANQAKFTPEVGQQCIAQFTEDDGWYRAVVKAVGDDGSVTVLYIDYGNSEALTRDRLCVIQAKFTTLAAQAITYNVAPPLMHSSQWNDDVKVLLDGHCIERELKVNIVSTSGDVPTIRLSEEDVSFIKTALGDALPPVVEAADEMEEILELGDAISLLFLSAVGPSTLSCQPLSTADALATLMDEIAEHYEEEANQVEFAPEVGQQCIAQFTEDDGWYRAIVKDINDDDYIIKYVDYGNCETLKQDRLREIQPQFQELPNQAVAYQVKPDLMHMSQWNNDVKEAIDEKCIERELKGHLVKTSDCSLVLKLSQDDVDFIISSVADILPPVVKEIATPKDEVDDIVESLVNTAISDALEEMTAPATIQDAAGVTVMTLFDKVATCLLIDELKKDPDPSEAGTSVEQEQDTISGVKKLVDDIVKQAVSTVTGEDEEEEEGLPHQILDEIIESVAGSLHISSATEVLDADVSEDTGAQKVEGEIQLGEDGEHPSPHRKRHKSGEGLPGMEVVKVEDLPEGENGSEEETKEIGEPDIKKMKEDEVDSIEEEEEEELEQEAGHLQKEEQDQEATEKEQEEEEDHEDGNESAENFEDAEDNVADDVDTGDMVQDVNSGDQNQQDEAKATTEEDKEKTDDEALSDQADEATHQAETVDCDKETKEDFEADQEESFESAPSTPERDSETAHSEGGGDVVNGDDKDIKDGVNDTGDANHITEKGDSVDEKLKSEKTSDNVSDNDEAESDKTSDTVSVKTAGDSVEDVTATEETTEG